MQSYILSPVCKVPRAPDEPLGLLGGVPPLLEEPRMSLEKDGHCFIVCFCGERMVRRYYELVVGNRALAWFFSVETQRDWRYLVFLGRHAMTNHDWLAGTCKRLTILIKMAQLSIWASLNVISSRAWSSHFLQCVVCSWYNAFNTTLCPYLSNQQAIRE